MTNNTERTVLLAMLAEQREIFRVTLRDITEEQARRRTTVSELTLGGLLRHVSNCERHWLQVIVERDENAAVEFSSDEYAMGDADTVAGLVAAWDDIAARTEAIVEAVAGLDEMVPLPTAPWSPEREWWPVRQILLHVFREIAQHSGHADIIRESFDGANTTYTRAGIDEETLAQWT